ncbi:MAG: MBL fold metallo-hydrolase [Wujia sp.]
MVTLKQIGKRTYYFTGLFRVGVYVMQDVKEDMNQDIPVCLIDSGLDAEYAGEMDAVLVQHHFRVQLIINTHYHADHSGGNAFFKEKYDCTIVATKMNAALISNYDICPALVWGAAPLNEIMNHYFYTESSETYDIEDIDLPEGISYEYLPGHCLSMIAVRTSDDVLFLGDAVVSEKTLEHHSLTYIYEIDSYLQSLEKLETLDAALYVPYHADPVGDIIPLASANRRSVMNNIAVIRDICETPRTLEEIYSIIYNRCGYQTNLYRYGVEIAIIRTYLTYLHNSGELETTVENNYVKWYIPQSESGE